MNPTITTPVPATPNLFSWLGWLWRIWAKSMVVRGSQNTRYLYSSKNTSKCSCQPTFSHWFPRPLRSSVAYQAEQDVAHRWYNRTPNLLQWLRWRSSASSAERYANTEWSGRASFPSRQDRGYLHAGIYLIRFYWFVGWLLAGRRRNWRRLLKSEEEYICCICGFRTSLGLDVALR